MQIYQRGKSGTFWVRFSAPDGRRIHQSTRTTDQKQAQEYADRLKSESWRVCRLGERPQHTWQEAVLRFLSETQHKRTKASDVAKLRWLDKYLGKLMLDQINPDVINQIRLDICSGKTSKGGHSAANVNRHLALVRSILRKAAGEWDWIDKAPTVKLLPEVGRHGDDFRWLTRPQAYQLLDALKKAGLSHTAAMVSFTLATGLRETNVTQLTWDRVDVPRRLVWIRAQQSKSGRPISVPLNDDGIAVVRGQRLRHQTHVFSHRGKPIFRANTRAWKQVLWKLGLRSHKGWHQENFRWHDLRHTWASWHVMAGTPLEVLKQLGGWSTLDMVMRYAHLAPGYLAHHAENISGPNMAQIVDNFGNAEGGRQK